MAGLAEYDAMRARVKRDTNTAAQTQQDALDRRFARLGGLNSGAYIKQSQVLGQELNQQASNAQSDVDMQEVAEKRRIAELDANRKFATSERLGSQQFASGERVGTQQFASGERQAGQQFATGERIGSQQYATGERLGGQQFQQQNLDKDYALKQGAFDLDKSVKEQAMRLSQSEFDNDKLTTEFNKLTAIASSGDWRMQRAGVIGVIGDPLTSPGGREAARILAINYNIPLREIQAAMAKANSTQGKTAGG